MPHDRQAFRARVLGAFGARGPVAEELLAYNHTDLGRPEQLWRLTFPLAAELHVAAWEAYAAEAAGRGAWEVLRQRLPQLRFPVREGISQTGAYRRATRRGMPVDAAAPGLSLRSPDRLRLWVNASLAGPIPVLCSGDREDFVRLVQALSYRNEPRPVPGSMGACLVSGFNNWDRVRQYRRGWEARRPPHDSSGGWAEEFSRLIPRKDLYQDRFLIVSEGFYSNVAAEEMGLAPEEWRCLSLAIRLGHECTHYLTLRLFCSVRNHPLDELIADYAGIEAACGRYRADWFLRFVGLERFPRYREGARLENYRGRPPLSEAAFRVLQALVKSAADNLARLDAAWLPPPRDARAQALLLAALYDSTLEELASDEAEGLLRRRLEPPGPGSDNGLS